ncbi:MULTISPECIES: cell division protein ZipA C-terminal FtsZ-binding domain-containing protein [Acinetobacter]|jgi:cell division protein ZipA|uniref:Cell division protein ZipA n=1 Tax=Acinetobacter chengduensis TaxID=2420890 RepID=A0ABX9TST5_9GAMM|nr:MULTISPECIES: cell division protein ZipA C-terminal FtsZ-binding domain-containing protein [Acinetobacter]MBI1453096.1 cell division protein ZipA [Acinetobacter sp. FL51]RKG39612.1 cell division protein ZipA [Acinetobacter sp. WCHAc060007]RLL19172.1 cell division protein ZipA [Acinetobacter chengduensis]
MEITTILGIVVAVVIMLLGIRLLLKKPTEVAPSLETDLHIHPDSQQPVIPRHVREQLQTDPELRKEPVLSEVEAPADAKAEQADPVAEPIANESSEQKAEVQTVREVTVSTAVIAEAVKAEEKSPELSLNQIEKAEISEFEDESNILDAHLHEQKLVDEESALATAETYIALNVYPDSRALSGEKTLKVLMKYGLRFGEMACFHRYSEDDSKLLFSVLQIGNDGAAAGFDLETLSTEQVKGLAFFLALPHSDVQNAFDTMDSISRLIAREIAGTVYDQNNQEFTPQLREHWRHQAIDYRIGQAVEA